MIRNMVKKSGTSGTEVLKTLIDIEIGISTLAETEEGDECTRNK